MTIRSFKIMSTRSYNYMHINTFPGISISKCNWKKYIDSDQKVLIKWNHICDHFQKVPLCVKVVSTNI